MTIIIVAILAYLAGVFTVAFAIVVGDEMAQRQRDQDLEQLAAKWRQRDANAAAWQIMTPEQKHEVMMGRSHVSQD